MKIFWLLLLTAHTILTIEPIDLKEPEVIRYPLHWLAFGGRHALIGGLVSRGVKVSDLDHLGRTPLHYAALNGNIPAIIQLISLGAAADVKDHKQLRPEYFALIYGHTAAYERLKYHRELTQFRRLVDGSPIEPEE